MQNPNTSVGFLMNDVARLLRRDFMRRAQSLGLSQAQCQALAYLSVQEGVKQVTLAESLEVQPITLARLIDRLQEAGLVARRPDPDDRRAFRLYLTPQAEPLLERIWSYAAATRADALAGLSEDARQALIGSLSHIKQNLLDAESREIAGTAARQDSTEYAAQKA